MHWLQRRYIDRSHDWKKKFAWLPTEVEQHWVWLAFYWVQKWHVGDGYYTKTTSLEKPTSLTQAMENKS